MLITNLLDHKMAQVFFKRNYLCHKKPVELEAADTDHHLLCAFIKLIRCTERLIHYNPKRLLSTFQHKTDQITMQINPRASFWLLAVGERLVASWINTKGIDTDFKQDDESDLQSSGWQWEKRQNVRILQIKYMTQTTVEEQGRNASKTEITTYSRPAFGRVIIHIHQLYGYHQWSKES